MMNKAVICIFLGVITGLTQAAGVLPDVLNAAVGDTVMFETLLDPTQTPFQTIIWNFNELPVPIFISTTNKTAPGYEDRLTVFFSTGSLELRDVALNDTGGYNVNILTQDGDVRPGSTMLNVYERVSTVSVTSSSSGLVELNSSVHLSCSSSGSSLSFRWLNGSSEVTAGGRVQITDGGSKMTIVTMTLYDQGPFRCHVSNAISNISSGPVHFTVSYGPYNVKTIGATKLEVGQSLVLICSAESIPSASYSWKLNGKMILNDSAVFFKPVTETSDSGIYTCEATNNVNGRSSSGEHGLSVHVPTELSHGAIAGIVIAGLLVVGGGLCGLAFVLKSKKTAAQPPKQEPEGGIYENTSPTYGNK